MADNLSKIAAEWHKAREVERNLAAKTYVAIRDAVEAGMTEVQVAELAGVNRMTVRRALGKL